MQYDIQSLDFPNTPALTEHARRRLGFGLARHADRVSSVVVRLGDENGPRGGPDKFCRLQVNLVDAPSVVIRDTLRGRVFMFTGVISWIIGQTNAPPSMTTFSPKSPVLTNAISLVERR